MEPNQSISQLPKIYPPQHFDTMATHYVHSLTSSPYYYFIPRSSYAFGNYHPHHHYVHNGPQFEFPQATIPVIRVPNSYRQQYSYVFPKTYTVNSESQISRFDQGEVEKSEQSSEEVREDRGESIDPRVVNILELFRQLYCEREETLKSILPGIHFKLSEFFKKVNTLVLNIVKSDGERFNARTLKRSLSLSSSPPRNEWFKVRPIDSEDTLLISPDGEDCT